MLNGKREQMHVEPVAMLSRRDGTECRSWARALAAACRLKSRRWRVERRAYVRRDGKGVGDVRTPDGVLRGRAMTLLRAGDMSSWRVT